MTTNRQQLAQLEVLWTAAETGDHSLVESILEQGTISPDITDEEGITLVHTAAANGHAKVLQCLLDRGAKVNARSFYQWTPLMQASAYGQISCTSILVKNDAEINATNVMGASALVCAARGGHTSVVHALLLAGASVDNELGGTVNPLMSAAIAGHESVCRLLLDKGANVNATMKDTGWTPLMFAAHNGYLEVVQVLVKHGADTNAINILEAMALDLCIASGHEAVEKFLSKNSDTTLSSTMKRRLRADLFQATKDGDFDQCQKLIEDGADVNRKDDDGATCLIFAAMRGWLAISELLVDNSAEVDVQDAKSGWTALMQATYYGHKSIARLLIDSGADISLQASNSCTAFDIASIIGDTEVVRLLAQASMRIGPPPKASKKMFNPTASPAPRTASPLKPTAKSSPRSSPQMKKKVLSHQPGSLLSLRAREADGTLRADRGPSTLAALAGAGADLGEDTLRSDMHSFGGTMGSMGMSTTSTMGSTSSAGETGAALRLAKSNSLENERKSKKNGKEASKRKGSSLRPFRSQNKVSPGKPSRVSSSGRPGSAEKKDGKKKSWWRRTAARFAKFLRRSARVEVSPTGPASDDARQEQQQQQQQQQHQQQQQQQQQVGGPRRPSGTSLTAWGTSKSPTTSQVSSAGSADGAPAQFKVDTLPKRNKGKGKASAMAAKPMVVPRYDQPGQRPQQRASTTSIGSVTRPKTAAGEQADNLRVKSPARNQAPAPPPWRKNGSLMSQDPMNLSILSAAQNGEIAHGGPGKRPSLNMGAPMSTLPANIMAPIKPPFMPPPAFELHHIERPKFERPSSRAALPDSSSSGGGGGEPVRRSSKPFVRPSIHGHGARNTVDKKTWSLPRKSVDAGGGASGKFGPPKKRKSGPRVSFLSPTPVEEQKTRAGSTSSTGSGAATEAHTASGGSAGSSLNNSGAGASARKREAATLKDVLQRHKLMEHFSLFDEQDIDLEAFLTMTDEDMVELGLKDAGSRAKLCAVIVKIRGSKQGQGISRVDSAVTQFRNANAERRRSSMSMPPKRAGSTSSIGSNAPMPLPPKQQSRPPQGRLPPPASGGGRLPQVREAAGGKKPPLN